VPASERGLGALLSAAGVGFGAFPRTGLQVIAPADRARIIGDAVSAAVDPVPVLEQQPDPGGVRIDVAQLDRDVRRLLPTAPATLIAPEDTARIEANAGSDPAARDYWTKIAVHRADGVLGTIRAQLRPSDLLMVLSPIPPVARLQHRLHVGAFAAIGAGIPPGLAFSGTTRRPGVLSLEDVTPTVLARLGVPILPRIAGATQRVDGRPLEARAKSDPLPSLLAFERAIIHSAVSRLKLTRLMMLLGMAGVGIAAAFVFSGRGKPAGTGRRPVGSRDWVATGLIGVASLPLALLIEPLVGTKTTPSAIPAVLGIAAGVAHVARWALGRRRGLLAVLSVTAVLTLIDLALNSPLSSRSTIGFQIAGGGRFYGVDEGMMGVIIGSALFAGALALDPMRQQRLILPLVAAGFAAAVFLLGAPSFGSKFGAPFTAIPAFGLVAARAGGRRTDRVTVIGLAIATVFTSGAFAASDALRNPQSQSHIGRVVAGATHSGGVISEKVSSFFHITFSTIWLPATLWFLAAVGLLLWRRRSVLARGLWGMPNLRTALWAALVGSAVAMVANDTGIITAAPLWMLAAATLFLVLLAPD
jgi:hypothetical protein